MSEKQYEKVLRLLRLKPMTTRDFVSEYILAPQKCIEMLRKQGYCIYTEPVRGQKYSLYRLVEQPIQRGLFEC